MWTRWSALWCAVFVLAACGGQVLTEAEKDGNGLVGIDSFPGRDVPDVSPARDVPATPDVPEVRDAVTQRRDVRFPDVPADVPSDVPRPPADVPLPPDVGGEDARDELAVGSDVPPTPITPCERHADCASGWCIPLGDGSRGCTVTCTDTCDGGWTCIHDDFFGEDVGLCFPPDLPACAPDGRCDDDDPCTSHDGCIGGVCFGKPYACDDGHSCTDDRCDGAGGCTAEVRAGFCLAGDVCVAEGGSCDDGDACTRGDLCVAGRCVGAAMGCDDDDACTEDSCTAGTCTHAPLNGIECDDGDACTVADLCKGGVCSGVARDCDDREGCTADACADGACVHTPLTAVACDDGDACTSDDACSAGACVGTARNCVDDEACTLDRCVDGSCRHEPRTGTACDDGDPCTVGDACTALALCQPGPGRLDADGDGHVSATCAGDDCDDALAAVHPGLPEVCANRRDDDCDGATDLLDDECAGAPPCTYHTDCGALPGTFCARWPVEGATRCSEPCASSSDCAAGLVCYNAPGSAMVGFCATPEGGHGRAIVGSPCSSGADCRSGQCYSDADIPGVCIDVCSGEGWWGDDTHCPGTTNTCLPLGDANPSILPTCAPHAAIGAGGTFGVACTTDGYTFDSSLCYSGHCDLGVIDPYTPECVPLCGSQKDCPYADEECNIVLYGLARHPDAVPFQAGSRKTRDVVLGCFWNPNLGGRPLGQQCNEPSECHTGKCMQIVYDDPSQFRCTDYCTTDADCALGMECAFAELTITSFWLGHPLFDHQPAAPNESTLARICIFP